MKLAKRGLMRISAPAIRRSVTWTWVLLTAACSDSTTSPSAGQVYWRLQLNHHAVTLATVAPYDTIQLIATPFDQHGTPIATTPRPVYTTSDTSLTIDSTGLVRVHWTGSNVPNVTVVATISTSGARAATITDTAMINIVDWSSAAAVPTLDSLLFRPVPGDSARRALFDTVGPAAVVPTQAFDSPVAKTAAGIALDNVVVRYRSSDSSIASFVNPIADATAAPRVKGNSPGVVLLTAEATAYGKRRVDSLWYTVGYPLKMLCIYGIVGQGRAQGLIGAFAANSFNSLSLGTLVVGQGGAVLWENSIYGKTDDSLDIQFDDPTHVTGLMGRTKFPDFSPAGVIIPPGPGGNIPPFPAAVPQFTATRYQVKNDSLTSKARVFMQPGTYRWSSQRQGISGTVVVIPNDSLHPTTSQ